MMQGFSLSSTVLLSVISSSLLASWAATFETEVLYCRCGVVVNGIEMSPSEPVNEEVLQSNICPGRGGMCATKPGQSCTRLGFTVRKDGADETTWIYECRDLRDLIENTASTMGPHWLLDPEEIAICRGNSTTAVMNDEDDSLVGYLCHCDYEDYCNDNARRSFEELAGLDTQLKHSFDQETNHDANKGQEDKIGKGPVHGKSPVKIATSSSRTTCGLPPRCLLGIAVILHIITLLQAVCGIGLNGLSSMYTSF